MNQSASLKRFIANIEIFGNFFTQNAPLHVVLHLFVRMILNDRIQDGFLNVGAIETLLVVVVANFRRMSGVYEFQKRICIIPVTKITFNPLHLCIVQCLPNLRMRFQEIQNFLHFAKIRSSFFRLPGLLLTHLRFLEVLHGKLTFHKPITIAHISGM